MSKSENLVFVKGVCYLFSLFCVCIALCLFSKITFALHICLAEKLTVTLGCCLLCKYALFFKHS